MTERFQFQVGEDRAGERLDVVLRDRARELHSRGEGVSRSQVQRWIAAGAVTVAGEPREKSYQVEAGQTVRVDLSELPETERPPEERELDPIELEVLYRDEHFAALNKPRGIAVHHAPGSRLPALIHHLPHHFPELEELGDDLRTGLVHRLDKETSGVLLIAFDRQTLNLLQEQFREREVEKEYRALCFSAPERREGMVRFPIGRSQRDRTRMTKSESGKRSRSHYRLRASWEEEFSELAWFPVTGRTHQIRVHAEEMGCPLVGDTTYGRQRNSALYDFLKGSRNTPEEPAGSPGLKPGSGTETGPSGRVQSSEEQGSAPAYLRRLTGTEGFAGWRNRLLEDRGHLLVARSLSVEHPWKGERMTFTAEPPEIFRRTAALFDAVFEAERFG